VTQLRIREAAALLGVSDDTIRRLVDAGTLTAAVGDGGPMTVNGYELAMYQRAHAVVAPEASRVATSARNQLVGLVTAVTSDAVMSQVEMQCGPFRVVSLMSTEAVRELALEPGSLAVAVIKSTNVVVQTRGAQS
jgi:molybdopterin-binding protein